MRCKRHSHIFYELHFIMMFIRLNCDLLFLVRLKHGSIIIQFEYALFIMFIYCKNLYDEFLFDYSKFLFLYHKFLFARPRNINFLSLNKNIIYYYAWTHFTKILIFRFSRFCLFSLPLALLHQSSFFINVNDLAILPKFNMHKPNFAFPFTKK